MTYPDYADQYTISQLVYGYMSVFSLVIHNVLEKNPPLVITFLSEMQIGLNKIGLSIEEMINQKGVFNQTYLYHSKKKTEDGFYFGLLSCKLWQDEKPEIFDSLIKVDKPIHFIIYDCIYKYADFESQRYMMQRKWNSIDYRALKNYIYHEIYNQSKELNYIKKVKNVPKRPIFKPYEKMSKLEIERIKNNLLNIKEKKERVKEIENSYRLFTVKEKVEISGMVRSTYYKYKNEIDKNRTKSD